MREDFKTTLKPESKINLKILSAILRMPMNEILEELIQQRKEEMEI